jgi:hypothetical protein
MNEKLPKKDYVIGIVRFKDKFLILRFRKDYDYCPGDWDFITKNLDFKFNNLDDVMLETINHHIGLKGKIIKKYKSYDWADPEYKILWFYFPYLVEVDSDNIQLNPESKYDSYKWIDKNEILSYDRLDYFKNALKHTIETVF